MLLQTTVKFMSALVGTLVAFYLASHLFHHMGFLSAYELQRVGWMYNQLLEPITSLDWAVQKTALIAIAALLVNALLVGILLKKWSYQPVKKIDPLARLEKSTVGVIASGDRLPTREVVMYSGRDSGDDGDALSEHQKLVKADEEEARLLGLLGK